MYSSLYKNFLIWDYKWILIAAVNYDNFRQYALSIINKYRKKKHNKCNIVLEQICFFVLFYLRVFDMSFVKKKRVTLYQS